VLSELKQGFAYAFGSPPIRSVIILLALVSLVGMPYIVLMPVFAKVVLHGGPQTLGFLLGAAGVGALTGAAFLASRKNARGLGKITGIATIIFGSGLLLLSFSRILLLSLSLVFVSGLGMMVMMASSNTVLQTVVHDDKRARVMSLFTMAFMGTVPLGSLMAGSLANSIGTPRTLMLGGAVCIVAALMYIRKLPELNEKVKTQLGFELFQ
jgi:predicted MFS family arabinose efflux permease